MKETIIIIVILILIFTGAWSTQKYLADTSTILVSKLENLKQNLGEGKQETLNIQTDEIYAEWKNVNDKWAVIVLHDELDLIETSLISMKSKIKVGNLDESLEDINTSIFLLNNIIEKEKTCLKNIF